MTAWFGLAQLILAQADGASSFMSLLFPFVIIALLFYFMLLRPQRQEQGRIKQMQENLKKNDRVVTAGGIMGIVVDVQKDSAFVKIKVDESSNTRLSVLRSSITRILADDDDEPKAKKDVN